MAATTLSPTLQQQQQSNHQFSFLRRTGQNALNTIFKPDNSNKDKVRALSFASDISVSTSISPGNSASSPLLHPSTGRSWSLSSQQQYEIESTESLTEHGKKQKYWRKRMIRMRNGQYQVTSDHIKVLRVVWYLTLVFGEHAAFWVMLRRCEWPAKESWDQSKTAVQERYRIVIIADPQLTDWYSYKQTGLALWLTEFYTDLFMRKSFARLHRRLQPDMVLFLGDLMDGGRETVAEGDVGVYEKNKSRFLDKVFDSRRTAWNQEPLVTDEEDIGEQEGLRQDGGEYETRSPQMDEARTGDIAGHYRQITYPATGATERAQIRQDGKSARLYVAGNHDVGFGDTLVLQAMKRYKGDFGSVNYEIKIANHSLVILDTLSLSSNITSIREESRDFLAKMEQEKPKEPRMLFTHVPLFRPETTSCGEAREAQQLILDRNGEQYQNMVNASLSREILRKVQPDMIFSGDDHDWCEIGHSLDGRLTPEVTLPTFSFAQGIKQPGFVVLSLYNPQHISRNSHSLMQEVDNATTTLPANHVLESHMAKVSNTTTFAYDECMLPRQMVIYSGYLCLLLCTLLWLVGYRFLWLKKNRRFCSDSMLVRWNPTVVTNAMSSNCVSSSPHPLQVSTLQEQLCSPQETAAETFCQQQKSTASHSFRDDEGKSIESPRTSSFSHSNTKSPLLPLLLSPLSPLSPLMNSMKRHRVWRRIFWPLQRRHFWVIVAWDTWDIVRYVIPFYLLLIFTPLL
ncbi:hypothetical protein EC957_003492 [Mortierella hygrophila]|uniref:Calcineurin-like phosphoesterase domain-containing protein n=1 Tax=Mortierella hygrophila TaxID=979708 RepID=A0A9P6FGB7_9FUNG|nr:hypothetical protein EC957_003492 [Mortierella hygrophila]